MLWMTLNTRLHTESRGRIRVALLLCALILGSPVPRAWAADPQPYTVAMSGVGDAELDAVLVASSQLFGLRESSPVSPFALIQRARSDIARLQIALDSRGYYQNQVSITINGLALTDPGLPAALDQIANFAQVRVVIDKGALYHLGKIALEGDVPEAARGALKLRTGDPAVADTVLDARVRMREALQEDGYALADVEEPVAFADDERRLIGVTYRVQAGRRANVGLIRFRGLKDVNETFAREALTIRPGERYRPSRIEAARQMLASLGVFSSVTVQAAQVLAPDGTIPLTFEVAERERRTVSLSALYSTDLGLSLSVGWSHHNLFGNAEQLNLTAAGTGLGTASAGLGYSLAAQFVRPLFLAPNQVLEVNVSGVKQKLDAYDQVAETVSAHVRRKFSDFWSGGAGLSLMHDQVTQQGATRLYQLVGLPVSVGYNSTGITDVLLDPVSGVRASVALTPTQSFGASRLTFAVLQASGSTYLDFGRDGRSVLALRALVGSIVGGANLELPPDQRLYAGGSATVRGYAYQSIGPQFPDGSPVGAKSVNAATVEFRQRILEDWGAAAFVDAGQASAGGMPFSGPVRVGAGLGARYYTPFGTIRADVALPLTPIRGGDAFQVYIGLGQAF